MDAAGHARISDFGGSIVTQDPDSTQSVSGNPDHAAQWAAPEITGGGGTYSKEADVYTNPNLKIEVRYEWIIFIHPWLTLVSYYYRYSTGQLRSMIAHPTKL